MSELLDEIAGARGLALYELLRQRLVRRVDVATPAAGAEWSQAVPAGVSWEVLAIVCNFSTSAAVATRAPAVRYMDGAIPISLNPAAQSQTASLARGLGWNQNYGDHATVGNVAGTVAALSNVPLYGGQSLGTITSGLDVGDAYSAIALVVREWSAAAVRLGLEWIKEHYR